MTDFLAIADEAINEHGAMQKRTELAALLAIADCLYGGRLHPTFHVWEIGTATGGTLWALADTLGYAPVYTSIDLPGGPHGGVECVSEDELRTLLAVPHVEIIRGDSKTVWLPETRPDLLLIDGDHSAEGVRADWERYAPRVKTGMIALHDILPHPSVSGVEVAPVWAEIVTSEPDTVEIVDLRPAEHGGHWGGWGVVFR